MVSLVNQIYKADLFRILQGLFGISSAGRINYYHPIVNNKYSKAGDKKNKGIIS